ncbi:hypothetical protein Sya03_02790 [Spirilliplanes yamanashiensis]|uniref:Uncharacterized protein n=1 Tax=Spirilliplanes yamanashiensis TaxID=42233 RepID=A0A8J4DFU4_9ACTN|nr:hypothetical protein Sya03_02790 [Spirilliplanes yamanashiensis]
MESRPAARPVTAALAGTFIAGCAAVALVAALAPGLMKSVRAGSAYTSYWPGYASYYLWALLPFLGGLALAGLVLAVRPRLGRPAAAVSAVLAAQAAGFGAVAVRDWFNMAGAGPGLRQSSLALVVGFAAVVAIAAAVAGCAAVAVLWREPAAGWRGAGPRRPAWVVAGVAVAMALPPVLTAAVGQSDVTTLGQLALTYGLPWGGGLALAGWLGRRGRIAVLVTIGLSVALVASRFAVAYLRYVSGD